MGGLLVQTAVTGGVIERASYDGNGNITAWTKSNATTGATSRREYDAFGNTQVSEGVTPCTFGFSTKMQDVETGLYYYGYRHFDPAMGRWLNRDPIEEGGGVNLYNFGQNSSPNGCDGLGQAWYDTAVDVVRSEMDNIRSQLENVIDSGVNDASKKVDEVIKKAIAEGKFAVSWRKTQKLILWKTKNPFDFEVSGNSGYGVDVKSGSSSSDTVRGSLFVYGGIEGRYKSPPIANLAWAKVIVGGGGQVKYEVPYCFERSNGDLIMEKPKGSASLYLKGGLRWETDWFGGSWFNDYWSTNVYAEGMMNFKWKWKLPKFEDDGFKVGGYIRAVTEKQQRWPGVPDPRVFVTEHVRLSWGDQVDF